LRILSQKFYLYIDGGARGNPGPAAVGVALKNENKKTIETFSQYLGKTTNNQAEYQALILGLGRVIKHLKEDKGKMSQTIVHVFTDSELVAKQLRGEYRVKHRELKGLFAKVQELFGYFKNVSIATVSRSNNKEADRLVNQELNKRGKFES